MNPNREGTVVEFGPFRLEPERRLLTNRGISVPFGGRALDILLVLVEHAPEVVSKKTLFERVWPGISVVESSLRVQMRKLRRALGDGEDGARYILTIAGRGYCFVAPLSRPTLSEIATAGPNRAGDTAIATDASMRAAPETNLLLPLANIIGRERELAELREWLSRSRLVTLIGLGGVGKTRLAVELGWRVLRDFPGGVWLIDLAPLSDQEAVAIATAGVLQARVTKSDTVVETIVAALGKARRLLIFDNCEHLIGPAATLITALLKRSPNLFVLATSQEDLRVPAELVYRLNPLEVPPAGAREIAGFPAAELFLARARAVDRLFELHDGNSAGIGEICRQLDGLPLALELAASRLRMLGVEALRKGLNNRLILLKRQRAADPRHASLRAMLEWSHGLLAPYDQQVFRRLGAFPGSFSLDAATAVADGERDESWDVLDALGRLLDRSLISLEQREPPRYRLLETLRLYAVENLAASGEATAVAGRHARFFTELFDEAERRWEETPAPDWIARYHPELDNLRAALDWALAEPTRRQMAISLTASGSLLLRDVSLIAEARKYLDRIIPLVGEDAPPATTARLLKYAAVVYGNTFDRKGLACAERAATLYRELDDRPNLGCALVDIALYGFFRDAHRHAEAKAVLLEAQQLLAGTGWKKSQLRLLHSLGTVSHYGRNIADARRYYTQAIELASAVKSVRAASILAGFAVAEYADGNIDRAIELSYDGIRRARSLVGQGGLGHLLSNLAAYLIAKGRPSEARPALVEALSILVERNNYPAVACLQPWALLAAVEGRLGGAAHILGFADAERVRRGNTLDPAERPLYDRLIGLLEAGLQPAEIEALKAAGALWSEAEAIEFTAGRLLPAPGQDIADAVHQAPPR